jgi:hypothetical protein
MNLPSLAAAHLVFAAKNKDQKRRTHMNRRIAVITGVLLGILTSPPAFAGSLGNPGVPPPQSHAFGKTYGQWSAEFWKWSFSHPVDHHPLFDTADCGAGQSGKVFFLGGVFNMTGIDTRNCRIPAGQAIFFPLVNNECSTLEGNGTTEAALLACASGPIDTVSDLEAEIDGVPVHNLRSYRAQSPLFIYGPLPDNNIFEFFGVPDTVGRTSPSVSDGYYLMLAPLSVGRHELHFVGKFPGPPVFIQDITYHLTIVT